MMIARKRSSNPCKVCGRHVEVGESIAWSRRNPGVVYHGDCYLESKGVSKPETKVEESKIPSHVEKARVKATVDVVAKAEKSTNKLRENDSWDKVLHAVLPFTNRVLLVGPPSSGKSTTAMLLANTKHRVTMTETTSREDLIGMFHLIAGETKWVDGPVTTAMRNGEAVLFDEVDRYSPECASLFYSLIDDKPHVGLPNGELLVAAEGYKVIMTTNETLETLPPAVQDRIEVIINANVPHDDVIADLPKDAQNVVMKYYRTQPVKELCMSPTVRRMKAFNRLSTAGVPNEIAAKLVFGLYGAREILSALTSAQSNY